MSMTPTESHHIQSQSFSAADSESAMSETQAFAHMGYYNGQIVAVKFMKKPYIYLSAEVIREINEVR